jgi:prevent-host-death family protein
MNTVSLTNAKAHLSELVSQAASGEAVCIIRRGKPVAKLTAVQAPRRPVDLATLRTLTDSMPLQAEPAGEFIRQMRDGERY